MSNDTFTILGLAGSLRKQSYNRALLRAAQGITPPNVHIEIFDLNEVPMFNEDLEQGGDPPVVQALKASIAKADALLIASPENNYSIPAVLKNAIDWASRSPDDEPSVLMHKPVAIMGASLGRFGTVRAQQTIRQVLHFTESYVLLKPEVLIARSFEHIDPTGSFLNEQTKEAVRGLIEALVAWTEKMSMYSK